MRRSWGMAVAAVLVATAGVVLPSGVRAGAQEALGLTVTPSTGLTDGQVVQVEVTGLPTEGAGHAVFQCDEPVAPGAPLTAMGSCAMLASSPGGEPSNSFGVPLSEAYVAFPVPTQPGVFFNCSDEPFDCSVVAIVYPAPNQPIEEVASVPIDFTPSPLKVLGSVYDPGPTEVAVALQPGATVTLAQCVDFVGVPRDIGHCQTGPTLTLPASGRATATIYLNPVQAVDGVAYDCLYRPCQVVAFDPAGNELAATAVPGSIPSARITLEQTTNIPPGALVDATIEATSGALLGECRAAVLDGTVDVTQGCKLYEVLPGGTVERELRIDDEFTPYAGGPPVVCADDPGGCVIGVGNGTGGALSWYVPVTFGPRPTLTLSPSTGLLDGQTMTVQVTGLQPGQAYVLRRCSAGDCEIGTGEHVAAADGTITATVVATAVLDKSYPVVCRDDCEVAAVRTSDGMVAASAGYAMATGTLSTTPSTGLVDGQTVTVSGTGLMPTYDGPMIWVVHTGQWALGQCDKAILDQQTLLGVFTHCAGVPGGGPGDIGGSTVSHPVEVAADLEKILGGTTDCTAAAGNCVVALLRMELDGGITVHSAALTFV